MIIDQIETSSRCQNDSTFPLTSVADILKKYSPLYRTKAMAPGIISDPPVHSDSAQNGNGVHKSEYPQPLKQSGELDKFDFEEATPVIGREYPKINIVDDLFNAPNADELLRDLAITISQRGVVFFRSQNNLTDDLQKQLVHRLGQLSGKPSTSSLHIHPVLNTTSEFGIGDDQISHISSIARKKMFSHERSPDKRRYDSARWHSDIQFEPNPADYTSLRLTQLPSTGGDTLWASGYELYDRFSKTYQKFFEGLTATFIGEGFIKAAQADPEKVQIWEKPRGSPNNTGKELTAIHPVVRTNPVTGWKSIYSVGAFPKFINELSGTESEEVLKKFYNLILENHDLTVRYKWRNPNDLGESPT